MNNNDGNKKIIHINPELFSYKGLSKTRKKKITPLERPIISPTLKENILIRRLKENKQKQLENQFQKPLLFSSTSSSFSKNKEILHDHDESTSKNDFNDSMEYLQSLSSIQSIDKEKELYEKNKQKKINDAIKIAHNPYRLKEHIEVSSISTSSSSSSSNLEPFMHMDLPNELNSSHYNTSSGIIPSYKVDTVIPYGILRSGIKPTYRDWAKTQKKTNHYDSLYPTTSFSSSVSTTSSDHMKQQKELKLQMLRNQIKQKQLASSSSQNNLPSIFSNHQTAISESSLPLSNFTNNVSSNTFSSSSIIDSNPNPNTDTNTNTLGEQIAPIKKFIKKTIKHKYSLGRSKIKNSIGILIKNNTNRKKIIDAQKQLKTHSIQDVKQYLREHNLLKIGTNAPNDILRKLYETSILSGDITNINTNTILYNLSKNENDVSEIKLEDIFTKDEDKEKE